MLWGTREKLATNRENSPHRVWALSLGLSGLPQTPTQHPGSGHRADGGDSTLQVGEVGPEVAK